MSDTGSIPQGIQNASGSFSNRRYVLDLFCGAGGAAMGLHQAGYIVLGVDIEAQPNYPFEFCRGDAFEWLSRDLSAFDLLWLSPKCQAHSVCTPVASRLLHEVQLPRVLDLVRSQSVPYIVENVEGGQVHMLSPVKLCGSMFGLPIRRHRYFELGNTDAFFLLPGCNHSEPPVVVSGVSRRLVAGRRYDYSLAEKSSAMGIDWMTARELDQAIPPVYARFLASQVAF